MKSLKGFLKLAAVPVVAGLLLGGIGGIGNAADPPPGISTDSYAEKLFEKFGRKPVVACSVPQYNNVTIQAWMDAMRGGAELHGIELILTDGLNDGAKQVAQYENFVAQQVDLILVSPVDNKAIVPVIKRMNEAGIPVVNFDSRAEGGEVITYVGMDWFMAGIMSGLQIVEATGGKGRVSSWSKARRGSRLSICGRAESSSSCRGTPTSRSSPSSPASSIGRTA